MSLPSKMRFGAQVHCFTTPPLSGFFKPAHLLKLHRSQIDNASYRIPIASMWMHVPWYQIWYHICHFAAPYPCSPCRMIGSVADMANPFPASQTSKSTIRFKIANLNAFLLLDSKRVAQSRN